MLCWRLDPLEDLVPVSQTSSDTQPALLCEGVSFSYEERKALDGINLQVAPGEIYCLLGPNGGGKTTLFRILATLLHPDEGSARILGFDVVTHPLEVRRSIGVVFQNQSLDRRLSVRENLEHQGRLYGLSGQVLDARINEVLARTGLSDRGDELIDKLSGGLKRRVELSKGLLHQPKILLLDEPSTGVDPAVRLDFWSYLSRLREETGVTVLLTTHILDEADKCDRLAILDEGKIVADGSPNTLKSRIGGDVVAFETDSPETLAAELLRDFKIEAQVVGQTVRFERDHGPSAVAELMRSLPPTVRSATVARPTLEDVFVRLTGRRFGEVDGSLQ